MTYHDDQRRRLDEPAIDRRPPPDSGMSWGLPLGIAAVVIVLGLIFYSVSTDRTTTASNTGGTTQSTSSAPSTANSPNAKGTPSAQPATPPAKSQ